MVDRRPRARLQPQKLGFDVKVGDVGKYEVTAEAFGTAGLKARNSLVTDVFGMPDVDLVVSERQRVVDVGGRTIFLIRAAQLRHQGRDQHPTVGDRLQEPQGHGQLRRTARSRIHEGPKDGPKAPGCCRMPRGGGIKRLGPGKELVMGLEVKAKAAKPQFATCRVTATHDDLPGSYEDMAGVKVLPPSSRTATPAGR